MFWEIEFKNIQILLGFFADIIGICGIAGIIWGGKKIFNKISVKFNNFAPIYYQKFDNNGVVNIDIKSNIQNIFISDKENKDILNNL
ncbi:MAG: hypothetical protein V1698_01015 [bacterium]